MEKTRQSYKCPLFGNMEDLKENMLPTYENVMKFYEWTRFHLKIERNSRKEPSFSDIAKRVSLRIESIWKKASIPTVSHNRVLQLLKAYHSKCKNFIKSQKRPSDDKKKDIIRQSKLLFDICSCKCKDFLLQCNCSKERKVPKEEQAFLIDQRTGRKMMIGGIDQVTTARLKRKRARKIKSEIYLCSSSKSNKVAVGTSQDFTSTSSDSDDCAEVFNVPPTSQKKEKKISRSTESFPILAKTCDRYGVSDRAAAAIASAVLHDIRSNIQVIDKSKLRRERKKVRDDVMSKQKCTDIPALYFDGRKDKTLKIVKKGTKKYRQIVVEEHISVLKEPDSIYLGYAFLEQGTAKNIEQSIYALLVSEKISLENLVAIGCDGTITNTGKFGGVIRQFEKRINRPLQWIICLLHMNELPLRHLFIHLDGETTGPASFTGTIGKLLENCQKLPVINYEKIESELPEISKKDLSADQKYLYDITTAVIKGQCSSDLAERTPGKMSHARWLTKANRILRLYISIEEPSENLKHLATYVTKVYAPVWFEIKTHPTCNDGSRSFWKLISNSRYLSPELKAVIDPVIERNAYFAHPENLLLSMLTDRKKHIRELAARRILKARNSPHLSKLPRVFEVPKINLNATSYIDLIDWQENFFEPPVLRDVTDEEFLSIVESKGDENLTFLKLPCHTQAVERSVKTVTEASMQLCDKKSREGYIKAKIEARKLMPKFESKRDFKVSPEQC